MKQVVGFAVMASMGCIDNSIPAAEMDTGEPTALASDGAAPDRSLAASSAPWDTPGFGDASAANDAPGGDTADDGRCDVGDLQMVAEVRHDDGEPAAFGYPTQSHRLWVRVANPCETTVELETLSGCFVEGWRATVGAISASASFPCGGEPGVRRLDPGAVMEQEVTPFHDLVEGGYALSVDLGVADPDTGSRISVDTDYTVLSRAAR